MVTISITPATRQQVVDAIVDRRASRLAFDLLFSPSFDYEVRSLVVDHKPLAGMTTAELLSEWSAFDPDMDVHDYVVPYMDLSALAADAGATAAVAAA